MRLPITEKFLWDFYNVLEKLDEAYLRFPFRYRSLKESSSPELLQLRRKYERRQFSKLISYLKRKGLIRIKELEEKQALILTPKGKEKILKIKNKFIFPSKKKRKDGKWIMVAFDISERKRSLRNYFREKLIEFGFLKFQQSIWICPYDVLKEVQELARNLGIEKEVRIFLIEEQEI